MERIIQVIERERSVSHEYRGRWTLNYMTVTSSLMKIASASFSKRTTSVRWSLRKFSRQSALRMFLPFLPVVKLQ